MKICLTFCLVVTLLLSIEAYGQNDSSTSAKAKTSLFTSQERDSLQLWFYDRATVMRVENEKREEFYNIILYHSFKMRGLEKKEKGYSPKQIQEKFEKLLMKQHNEVKAILDEKQYAYYLDTYDKLLQDVYDRKGWK